MHIGLLVTNTDMSDFAARHPRDREKFSAMIAAVRPAWGVTAFDLPQGGFPAELTGFDGFLIGGSPASVNDPDPWISRLEELVRRIHAAGIPLAGACFGHQMIAKALGGRVGRNPGPMVIGAADMQVSAPPPWIAGDTAIRLAAAHQEQVLDLPPGAEVIGWSATCRFASYRIDDRVFSTQYHPEMSADFVLALVDELAPGLGADAVAEARASVAAGIDGKRFAEWLAQFFEQAVRTARQSDPSR